MSQDPASPPQEFSPNTLLATYRIEERVGAGGMGIVYRAIDSKLGRSVALKVIRPELLHDQGLARFEREARVLASLNHPRIAAIHGMEESAGIRFLVLEYVPGPTLADRLRRGRLPLREALGAGKQIAEALEAAHANGIIHRDMKPANIKLAENCQVKVLDFGLAKPIERVRAVSADSTVTAVTTGTVIVGTAAYMSPEQACGKELDSRTDIWSFGCVLYEMVTGKQAFSGRTVTEILAAVVEREPDWTALPAETPEPVRALLKRCLRKDPGSRWRDAGDARIELEDSLAGAASTGPQPADITRRAAISALSGAAVGAAATGVFAVNRFRSAVPRKPAQFAIPLTEGESFSASMNNRIAISPDGTHIAFTADGPPARLAFNNNALGGFRLYLRSLAELKSERITDGQLAGVAFFSPDSRWMGFFRWDRDPMAMRKVALSGGSPVTICPVDGFAGGTWGASDTIYWPNGIPGALMSVPAGGGPPKEVAKPDFSKGERIYKYPCALSTGDAVLLTVTTADTATFDEASILAISPGGGQKRILMEGGTYPRYSPSGHLLYAHEGKIIAVPFDPKSLKIQGQPFTALEGVLMSRNSGAANFDISPSGDLAYIPGICEGGARTVVWVDRNGRVEPVPLPAKSYLHPRLSPDGRRLAIEVEGANHNLYIYEFDRGVLANITTDGVSHWPVWSPDGTELTYRAGPMTQWKLWKVPADRSRNPQQVPATGISQSADSWSPDGRAIAYTAAAPGVSPSIMIARLDGDHQAALFAKEKASAGSPKFSPDGRWLAYCSSESGKPQVYVQAYPGPGPKIQITSDGGTDPVWRRTGGELYYRNGDSMMGVAVSTAPMFNASRPQELWKGHYSHGMSSSCGPPGATSSNYDVTADGRRFLMIKDDDQDRAVSKEIVVVLGWAGELSRRAAKA